MNKKVIALLVAILIVAIIAGIIFAVYHQEENKTQNNNLGETTTNNKNVPFCSHGGGGFGQSITDISKLAPNSKIGEGLSIHYSGGSSLDEDISNWLSVNGIAEQ